MSEDRRAVMGTAMSMRPGLVRRTRRSITIMMLSALGKKRELTGPVYEDDAIPALDNDLTQNAVKNGVLLLHAMPSGSSH